VIRKKSAPMLLCSPEIPTWTILGLNQSSKGETAN